MEQQELQQSLIPGLPHEIALDCLVRLPYTFHSGLKSVCRGWRSLFSDRLFFYRQRRVAGKGEDFVFFVQALASPSGSSPSDAAGEKAGDFAAAGAAKTAPPVYGITVYHAGDGTWGRIPAPPSAGVPIFSQCVAVAGKLVVVGGWDPASLDSVADIYVYDLVGGRGCGGWRRGASMSTARSFFACAAVAGEVYVAGGHDNQKNALRSVEVYDPEADVWQRLPDMAEERDECHGLSGAASSGAGDGFWVVSGYGTESQGRFGSSAEFFDPSSGVWTRFDDVWPNPSTSPRTASCNPPGSTKMTETPSLPGVWYFEANGGVNRNSQSGVKEFDAKEGKWKAVAPMPEGVRSAPCVTVLEGLDRSSSRVLMIGSGLSGGGGSRHAAHIMEIGSRKWKTVEMPCGYEGFVFSACAVHL